MFWYGEKGNKDIIKTPEMMKALAISYGVVFGSFVLVIIVMRQMK
jgi:hypothetical protein